MKSFAILAGLVAFASSVLASPSVEANTHELEARQNRNAPYNPFDHNARHTHGKKCRGNYMCKTNVWGARPSCSAQGVCGFKCLRGMIASRGKCIPPKPKNECSRHRNCNIRIKNGHPFCYRGKCSFECDRGYHRDGDSCVRNEKKCDANTCFPVSDGYSECQDGKCVYKCATYLGYSLFTNANRTAYRCVNLESDPKNCGEFGNVCKPGYNGKGYPYCSVGTCELDCSGYEFKYTLNGDAYCTDNAASA